MNKNIDDGVPAFPTPPGQQFNDGMSLRNYIAIQAMQGDWSAQREYTGEWTIEVSEKNLLNKARLYYRVADAMIKVSKE